MIVHRVVQGEDLWSICFLYGISDPQSILNMTENAVLFALRAPYALLPGDELTLPDPTPRTTMLATGEVHRVVVDIPRRPLILIFRPHHSPASDVPVIENPYAGATWKLRVGGREQTGTVGGDGRIEAHVPVTAQHAELQIGDDLYALRIGHIDPINTVPGVRGRLRNLGYDSDSRRARLDLETARAVASFQRDPRVLSLERYGDLSHSK